jgi:transcriptional regulator with XRE-family HTH domain
MKNKSSRGIPLRLAEKLKQIRTSLGLSQKEISIQLEYKGVHIPKAVFRIMSTGNASRR